MSPGLAQLPVTDVAADADRLVQAVRSVYVLCRTIESGDNEYGVRDMPQWDGGEDAFGRVHRPVWPRLASVILRVEADPMTYIKAQFAASRRGRPPSPNQMMSDLAVENWRQYEAQARDAATRQLLSDMNAVENGVGPLVHGLQWDRTRAMRYCLNDTSAVVATPLFRFSAGVANDFPDVAARFRNSALLQYAFQRSAYDAAWDTFVPEVLRQDAARLHSRLVG